MRVRRRRARHHSAVAVADRIARNGPLAVAAMKRLMRESVGEVDWARVRELIAPVFASEDAAEGARAFTERRDPHYRGR